MLSSEERAEHVGSLNSHDVRFSGRSEEGIESSEREEDPAERRLRAPGSDDTSPKNNDLKRLFC